jgi:hypothetical protein
MNLTLFLGSGVSVPSGLPTVEKLTRSLYQRAYHEDGYVHFSPGKYRDQGQKSEDVIWRIRQLLRLLSRHDKRDIKRAGYIPANTKSSGAIFRGLTSYEDLFYLCEQMGFWSDGRVDNSLVTPMMELIEKKAGELLIKGNVMTRLSDLGLLAEKACHFIESVVAGELNHTKHIVGFDLILELATAPDVEQLNIVTLNHDALIEKFLFEKSVDFVDGFGERHGDVRWYKDHVYDMDHTKVRIFKLHGSVNWHSVVVAGRIKQVIFLGDDIEHIKDGSGKELRFLYRMPSFLTGINKAVAYQRGIYAEMHFRFHQILRQCEVIVMSGYGWGDTAINFRLDTWFDQCPRNTLIHLHEKPSELMNKSVIIASGYDGWIRRHQLIPIQKWLCNTTLNELRSHFDRPRFTKN